MAHTYTHMHSRAHTLMIIHTHTCTHAYTHSHMCKHICMSLGHKSYFVSDTPLNSHTLHCTLSHIPSYSFTHTIILTHTHHYTL
uniref:Uncharacterized protein n=1 Tax=Anguilla anguilla TaxID=7936 RepID=A0A0E9S1G2_ANGAN